jgi:cellobiose-specific phosphotransferase system component IIB
MMFSRTIAAAAVCLACACGASTLLAQQTGSSAKSWLDAPLTNWNTTVTAIPRAKVDKNAGPMDPRCNDTHRTGSSAEDKAIMAAGWTLFGQEQQVDDVALVTALTSVDGMCRPLGYQAFVFIGGKFAGTVSPKPMDSRADGSNGPIHLMSPSTLTVGFSRYKPDDALCCPSRRQIVTYVIDRTGARPLLVPRTVTPLTK